MPEEKAKIWTINIESFGGFVPAWFDNSYPFIGNKNQASDMQNIDIIDPNVLTQGPGTSDLTNGTQAGAVTNLISSILKTVTSSNVSFAVGGARIYQINATTVTSNATYPMTIDKAAVTGEVADDLLHYKSNLYVFYNHSGSAGDIAQVLLATDVLDPDWGSTIPTGAGTLQNAPHYAINGGDDIAYFTNARFVGTINGTTLTLQGIDFWENSQTVSVTWNENRVIIAVNRPNVSGSNFNESAIYRWDGTSPSWEGDPIEVSGEIGALYTKNGVTYVWWKDATDSGGYNLGYINGLRLKTLKRYSGSLPTQVQIGEWKGFIMWVSSNEIMMWGARDADLPVAIFQFMSGKNATIGGIAAPFGEILVASSAGANFALSKNSGYTTTSTYKTKAFKMNGAGFKAEIDLIQVETERLSTGAKVDITLTYDKTKSTLALTQIAYSATADTTIHKILNRGPQVEDFRLDFDFVNGSATNPVKIRSIMIQGRFIRSN